MKCLAVLHTIHLCPVFRALACSTMQEPQANSTLFHMPGESRLVAIQQAATAWAGPEIFWMLCDLMDCPVSSKARLLFLETKLQLFVSACCSES